MRYMLLIYWDEGSDENMSEMEMASQQEAYRAYTAEIKKLGMFLYGDALQPTATATTVRLRQKLLTTDGPFAETKEHLGGIYMLECEHLDDAIEAAAKIPHAQKGCVEIRPILEY